MCTCVHTVTCVHLCISLQAINLQFFLPSGFSAISANFAEYWEHVANFFLKNNFFLSMLGEMQHVAYFKNFFLDQEKYNT